LFVGAMIVWPLYLLLTGRDEEHDERVDARPRYSSMARRSSVAVGHAATMTMHWFAVAGTWAAKWWVD
jgi:hypothetical protein